jgi:hypothetical protein
MNKIKIALVAALLAVTSSAAFAASARVQQHHKARFQSAPVLQQRDVALPAADRSAGPFWYGWSGPTSGGM